MASFSYLRVHLRIVIASLACSNFTFRIDYVLWVVSVRTWAIQSPDCIIFISEGIFKSAEMEPLNGTDGQPEEQSKTEPPLKSVEVSPYHRWVTWWNGMATSGNLYLFILSLFLVRILS